MPLNLSYEGHSFPPSTPYLVGREKIREFARAVGADDPAHHDPEAAAALGHPDVIAPPTFPTVLTIPLAARLFAEHPDVGVDFSRIVHGDQRFAYVRPVRAGDALVCRPVLEKLSSRSGLDSVSLRTDITTPDGELVVTSWAKIVARTEG